MQESIFFLVHQKKSHEDWNAEHGENWMLSSIFCLSTRKKNTFQYSSRLSHRFITFFLNIILYPHEEVPRTNVADGKLCQSPSRCKRLCVTSANWVKHCWVMFFFFFLRYIFALPEYLEKKNKMFVEKWFLRREKYIVSSVLAPESAKWWSTSLFSLSLLLSISFCSSRPDISKPPLCQLHFHSSTRKASTWHSRGVKMKRKKKAWRWKAYRRIFGKEISKGRYKWKENVLRMTCAQMMI